MLNFVPFKIILYAIYNSQDSGRTTETAQHLLSEFLKQNKIEKREHLN